MQLVSDNGRDVRPRLSWRTVISRVPIFPVVMLGGVFVIFADLVWGGSLRGLDREVAQIWVYEGPHSMPIADIFDKIGQRTVTMPVLFTVAYVLSRRLGTIRPLVIAVAGSVAVNVVVGIIKVLTARESPRTGGPEMFIGNNLFPSGHTSNIVMMFGLAAALIVRYGKVTTQQYLLLVGGVVGIFVFMCGISVYRHTHWFTDLVAGGMVGAAVLDLCMRADAYWSTLRAQIKRAAGPAWAGIEWLTIHARRAVFRDGVDASGKARPAAQTASARSAAAIPDARRMVVVRTRHSFDDLETIEPSHLDRQRQPTISGWR